MQRDPTSETYEDDEGMEYHRLSVVCNDVRYQLEEDLSFDFDITLIARTGAM